MFLESVSVFCDPFLACQGGNGGGGGGDGPIKRSVGWLKERKVMISVNSLCIFLMGVS